MKRVVGIVFAIVTLLVFAVAQTEENTYLTEENCADLATVMYADYSDRKLMQSFAEKYNGQIVEVKGYIDYADRGLSRDIKVRAGVGDESIRHTPYFTFKGVSASDLGFQGLEFPSFIADKNNVRILGRVKEYIGWQTSFILEPILIEKWNPIAEGLDTSAYMTLQKGSTGDKVKVLQQRLLDLLYLESIVDGSYGNKTKEAVERFQKEIKVDVTGIADPITQAVLFSDFAPERKLSISCSSVVIGNSATAYWSVEGQEFTLRGNNKKTIKTIWGTYIFDAYGKYIKVD